MAMTTGWSFSVLLLLLVGAVTLAVSITALVLFVLGVVQKRPAFWVSGLVLGIVPLTVIVGAAVLVFAFSSAPSTRLIPVALSAAASMKGTTFEWATGVALPADAVILYESIRLDSSGPSITWLKVEVPDSFAATLDSAFDPDEWAFVKTYLADEYVMSDSSWGLADSEEMAYYTVNIPDFVAASPDGTAPARIGVSTPVYIAYDRAAGIMYVAIVQDPQAIQTGAIQFDSGADTLRALPDQP